MHRIQTPLCSSSSSPKYPYRYVPLTLSPTLSVQYAYLAHCLQTAHLRLLSHRLANFSGLSSAYIQTRDRLSHLSLTEASQQGLSNHPTTTATSDPDATGGIADIVRRLAAVPSSSSNSSVPVTVSSRSLDPRDLLRSIAQADSKGR